MKSTFLLRVIPLVIVAACSTGPSRPDPATLTDARHQLEVRGREDQEVRVGFGVGGVLDTAQVRAMLHTDSSNTAWLKQFVARWGWPETRDVGSEAENSAFLIVQHATQDTAFMRAMLPHIEDAARRGDLKGQEVALLSDRLAVKAGHPQTYGTQASLHGDRWVLDPIQDSAHVDERRARMGLPPLAVYKRILDSVYAKPPR